MRLPPGHGQSLDTGWISAVFIDWYVAVQLSTDTHEAWLLLRRRLDHS